MAAIKEQQFVVFYTKAETLMKEAIEKAPGIWHSYLMLASFQGDWGNWTEALQNISRYLKNTDILPDIIGPITDFYIGAAAAGYPAEALRALKKEQNGPPIWSSYYNYRFKDFSGGRTRYCAGNFKGAA